MAHFISNWLGLLKEGNAQKDIICPLKKVGERTVTDQSKLKKYDKYMQFVILTESLIEN